MRNSTRFSLIFFLLLLGSQVWISGADFEVDYGSNTTRYVSVDPENTYSYQVNNVPTAYSIRWYVNNTLVEVDNSNIGDRDLRRLQEFPECSDDNIVEARVYDDDNGTGTYIARHTWYATVREPDLRMLSSSYLSSYSVNPGASITAYTSIRNYGSLKADFPYSQLKGLRFYLSTNTTYGSSDIELGAVNINDFDPGESRTVNNESLRIPTGTNCGTYYILWYVDAADDIEECSNEGNNIYHKQITVGSPSSPPTGISGTSTICRGYSTRLCVSGGRLASGASWKWYSGSCGGTYVGTGSCITVSPSSTTTYYVRAEGGVCEEVTSCASLRVTVNPTATTPTSVGATNTSICSGASTRLYYSGGSGTTFKWYRGSCGGTYVGTGNNLTVSPTSTTTYYGRWESSCGNSGCRTVTITVKPNPATPTSVSSSNTTICSGTSVRLSYSGGSGTTFRWYAGSCGGSYVGTGNNLSVSPTSTTTYYGRWETDCGYSGCRTVRVTVNPSATPPASVSASNTTICNGASTRLNYSGGSGTSFRWYAGSCGGTYVGTGNSLSVSPHTTTTYYGRWEASCGNSTCKTVTITVNNAAKPPTSVTASETDICQGESVRLSYSGGSGSTFRWYAGACGGTLVGTGNSITVRPSSTTTYYGRWESSCGNSVCKTVRVTVNNSATTPASVSASNTTICSGESTRLSYSGGSGTTFRWYDGSCGGTLVGSGNNISVSPTRTTTYYGRWEADCGNSGCKTITVTVRSAASSPTSVSASNTTICEGASTRLTYTGGSGDVFRWYTSACGGTSVGVGNNLTVSPTTTTTYYGRWEADCGNSICKSVTITVNPQPRTPSSVTASNTSICSGNTATLSYTGGSGSTFRWYAGSCSGDLVGTGNNLRVAPASTTTYYGRWENNCGSSDCKAVTISVKSAPAQPGSITGSTNVCKGDPVTYSVPNVSGVSYNWNASGGTVSGSGNSVSVTWTSTGSRTLSVTPTNDCGNGTPRSTTIQVNDVPAQPGAISGDASVCLGESITYSVSSVPGISYSWHVDGGTYSGSGNSITVTWNEAGSGSVGVTPSNGCGSGPVRTKSVSVSGLPNVELGSAVTACEGETRTLNAGGGFSSYAWNTGSSSQSLNVTESGTYSVTVTNASGCEASDQVQVTFNNLPDVELGGPFTACTGEAVSLNAGSHSSYSWSNGAQTAGIDVRNTGSYSVTVTNTHGCTASDMASVTFHDLPEVELGGPYTACEGQSVALDAGNDGTNYEWSHGPSGQTVSVNSSGSYAVTVTNTYDCSASDVAEVTINPVPVVDLGGPYAACDGETVTLDAGAGHSSYSWSTGGSGQTLGVTESGSFGATVTNSYGCEAEALAAVTIHDLPEVDLGGPYQACEGTSLQLDAGPGMLSYSWSTGANTQTIGVTESGTYGVSVTDNNSCENSDETTVSFVAVPSITFNDSYEACDGETIILNPGAGFDTYSWSTGTNGNTLTVSESGTYSVTVTMCGQEASASAEAIFHALPEVDLGMDMTVEQYETVTLDAGAGHAAYLWNTGDETQTLIVDNEEIGSFEYSVMVTSTENCENSDAIVITVVLVPDALTIEPVNRTLSVFPVPASDYLRVATDRSIENEVSFYLLNQSGQVVLMERTEILTQDDVYTLDIKPLMPGVYFLRVESKDFNRTIKVIIK